jgi:hypothetical protein
MRSKIGFSPDSEDQSNTQRKPREKAHGEKNLFSVFCALFPWLQKGPNRTATSPFKSTLSSRVRLHNQYNIGIQVWLGFLPVKLRSSLSFRGICRRQSPISPAADKLTGWFLSQNSESSCLLRNQFLEGEALGVRKLACALIAIN